MPQMSNRKFRIIMQTVCIFRGYCSRLSGEKTNAYRQQGTRNKEPNTRTKNPKAKAVVMVASLNAADFPFSSLCLY